MPAARPDDMLAKAERVLADHARPLDDRLTEVAELAVAALGVERAWIARVEGEWIRTVAGVAMVLADPRHPPLSVEKGVIGRAVRRMKTERVDDVFSDRDYYAATALTRSEMAAPMFAGGYVVGVANFEANRRAAFGEPEQQLVEALCRLMAPYLE